jgi:hypothetical protein
METHLWLHLVVREREFWRSITVAQISWLLGYWLSLSPAGLRECRPTLDPSKQGTRAPAGPGSMTQD